MTPSFNTNCHFNDSYARAFITHEYHLLKTFLVAIILGGNSVYFLCPH